MRKLISVGLAIVLLATVVVVLVGRHRPASQSTAEASGPRELVRGVKGIRQPRSTPEDEKVDAAALNAAADYAAAHNSTALIVSRHGHLIFERYWGGATRDTVVDSGAFARTLAAMLVGIALDERHIASVEEPAASFLESYRDGARANITVRELLQGDDPQPLVQLVEQLSGKRYAQVLSRELWKALYADDAEMALEKPGGLARADCCFHARQGDWMRVAELLLADGTYQGSRILPEGWVRLMAAPLARKPELGSQLFLGTPRDGFYLAGPGESRLWLQPALHLAVLRVGSDPKDWDESRIANSIVAAVQDRPAVSATDLSKLVPNH